MLGTEILISVLFSGYLDSITLEKSAYSGAIFETYVVNQILKSFANNGKDARKYLYYYRDNNGKEILQLLQVVLVLVKRRLLKLFVNYI